MLSNSLIELPTQTVEDVIRRISRSTSTVMSAPRYSAQQVDCRKGVFLAVESMKRHTTDEGWQLQAGLEYAGYTLCGHALVVNEVDTSEILRLTQPQVVVVQDKREWDCSDRRDFRDKQATFHNVQALRDRSDIFKLTVLKDAQQRPRYHRQSADEMGVHAWIVYYHPRIVRHVAPYVRPHHLIRTYHSLDTFQVPAYSAAGRKGCLLSGAVSNAYPFRLRLTQQARALPETTILKHPGYHMNGSATPDYLKYLTQFKVALCTASLYGYALRKLIEATACGCIVLTDLPSDEVLPHIDGNLVRVKPSMPTEEVAAVVSELYSKYDPERQEFFAKRAVGWYDFRAVGRRLADNIEDLRRHYDYV